MELLEKQLKHDNESNKSFTNEKQEFIKKINQLEQQVLKLEEENITLKKENTELQKLNTQILDIDNFVVRKCEDELQNLMEVVKEEQISRNSLGQMAELIEYNFKKLKYIYEKSGKSDNGLINGLKITTNTWQERRSARVDKQELLTLQLELKSVISDKQKIQAEFTKLQQNYDLIVAQLNESKNEVNTLRNQVKSGISESSRSYGLAKSDHTTSESDLGDNTFLKEYTETPINKRNMISINHDSTENFDYHNKFGHSFIIRTFITPIKCYICTSLMIGLVRQGYVCEGKQYCC